MNSVRQGAEPLSTWPLWLGGLFAMALDLSFWGPFFAWDWATDAFAPLCHQRGDRCLNFGDTTMAICSRCVGIYAGVVFACLRALWGKKPLALAGMLCLAALVLNGASFVFEVADVWDIGVWGRLILGFAASWFLVEFAWKREGLGRNA